MFYENIMGIFFIIDGSDHPRIKIVKELVDKLDKDLTTKLPIVFLINKQDVDGALNKNDLKDYLDLDKLDTNLTWTIR